MSARPYDLVIYGATGFTGAFIVEVLAKQDEKNEVKWAVAGRNEKRLSSMLTNVSKKIGKNVRDVPVIIADTKNAQSLASMASQTKLIINAVGPYRLHGEAVVKAAVENGASHVDISGEPAWLEKMQMKYAELAKEKGVYVVGACGWDSIPCDLGVTFTERNFPGDLNHIETFMQLQTGKMGYSYSTGTYQTLILGLSQAATDGLGKIRKAIMPERLTRSSFRPPKYGKLFKHEDLNAWCVPFLGADKSIVNRSRYFAYTERQERPFYVETYLRLSSFFWAAMLALWLMVFSYLARFELTRKILQTFPDQCSFNMFKESGPTKEQMDQASYVYWFVGTGWETKLADPKEQHKEEPNAKIFIRCEGPGGPYLTTCGCVLSAAFTILQDRDALPSTGGVYTSAAAFDSGTKIYERLEQFGITFRIVDSAQ